MKCSLSDIARQAVIDYTEMLDSSIIPGSMQPNTQAIRSMKHALARAQAALAQQAQPLTDEMIETESVLRWKETRNQDKFIEGAKWARDRMPQQPQPEDVPCKECRLEDGTHYLGCSIAQQAQVFRTAQPEDARLELWGKLYDAFLVFFTERGFVGEGASWNADSLAEQAVAVVQNLQQATRIS